MKRTTIGTIAASTLCAAILVLSGCSNNKVEEAAEAPAMGIVNETCPMKGTPIDESVYSEYEGGKVAFCCGGCKTKFDATTDEARAEMVAKVKK